MMPAVGILKDNGALQLLILNIVYSKSIHFFSNLCTFQISSDCMVCYDNHNHVYCSYYRYLRSGRRVRMKLQQTREGNRREMRQIKYQKRGRKKRERKKMPRERLPAGKKLIEAIRPVKSFRLQIRWSELVPTI